MSSQQLQNILSALQRQQHQQKPSQHGFSEGGTGNGKAPGASVSYCPTLAATTHDPSITKSNPSGEKETNVASGLSTLIRHRSINTSAQNIALQSSSGPSTVVSGPENSTKSFDNLATSFSMGGNMGYMSTMNDNMSGCVASPGSVSQASSYQFKDSASGRMPAVSGKAHDSRMTETKKNGTHVLELPNVNSSQKPGNTTGSVMWNTTGVCSSLSGPFMASQTVNRPDMSNFYNCPHPYREQPCQGPSKSLNSEGYVGGPMVEASVQNQFSNPAAARFIAEKSLHQQQQSQHEQQQQQMHPHLQLHLQQQTHPQLVQQQLHPHQQQLHLPQHHLQQQMHPPLTPQHQPSPHQQQTHPPLTQQQQQHAHPPLVQQQQQQIQRHVSQIQPHTQQPQMQGHTSHIPPQSHLLHTPTAQQTQPHPQHIKQTPHPQHIQQTHSQHVQQQRHPQHTQQLQQQPHVSHTQVAQQHQQHNHHHHQQQQQQIQPHSSIIVALRLEESSIAPGSWQFDINDIKRLVSCFGLVDWVKLLELPTGCDRAPNCVIAQFSGVGKLAVVAFPASLLEEINPENDGLESFILFKLQELSREPAPTGNVATNPHLPDPQHEMTLDYFIESLAEKGGNNDEGLAAFISAISRLDQSKGAPTAKPMIPGASSTSGVPSTLRAQPPQTIPPSSSVPVPTHPDMTMFQKNLPLRKHVCRLELVDMFSYPEFDVPAFIIGKDGSNIKYVLNEAKNQVDIDLVGMPINEASVAERLHLTVTSFDKNAYTIAVEALEDLLQSLCQQLADFCLARGGTLSRTVGFRRHEYKEGHDGQLIYLGQTERTKQWLSRFPPESLIR